MTPEKTNESTLAMTPDRGKNMVLPTILIAVMATAPLWSSRISSIAQLITKAYGEVPGAAFGGLAAVAALGLGVVYVREALRPVQRTFFALVLALAAIVLLTLGICLLVPLVL